MRHSCLRSDGREKVRYASLDDAWDAARRSQRQINPYPCDVCHGFHLGHPAYARTARRFLGERI